MRLQDVVFFNEWIMWFYSRLTIWIGSHSRWCKYCFQAFHPECIELPIAKAGPTLNESQRQQERGSQTELKGEGTRIRGKEGREKTKRKEISLLVALRCLAALFKSYWSSINTFNCFLCGFPGLWSMAFQGEAVFFLQASLHPGWSGCLGSGSGV